jgi:hypothetical protein
MTGDIRTLLYNLTVKWIGKEYAAEVNPPTALKELIIRAFVDRVPDGPETALLREAYKRLEAGAMTGWYP